MSTHYTTNTTLRPLPKPVLPKHSTNQNPTIVPTLTYLEIQALLNLLHHTLEGLHPSIINPHLLTAQDKLTTLALGELK